MWLYPVSVNKNVHKYISPKLCLTPEIKSKYFRIEECIRIGQTTVILAEAIDLAAGWIRLIIHSSKVNKAYNRCLFTRLPGKLVSVHPAVRWIVSSSPGSPLKSRSRLPAPWWKAAGWVQSLVEHQPSLQTLHCTPHQHGHYSWHWNTFPVPGVLSTHPHQISSVPTKWPSWALGKMLSQGLWKPC